MGVQVLGARGRQAFALWVRSVSGTMLSSEFQLQLTRIGILVLVALTGFVTSNCQAADADTDHAISSDSVLATVENYGASCDGIKDDSAAFSKADAAVPNVIIVDGAQCIINRSISLAHRLVFRFGGSLKIGPGAVLTLTATPEASTTQHVFFGAGAVSIAAPADVVYAEWWGAKTGADMDNGPAFQAAANAIARGGTIRALAGSYKLSCAKSDAVTIGGTGPINIYGAGDQATFFRPTADCSHFLFVINPVNQSGNLRDFAIFGDQLNVPLQGITYGGVECLHCGVMDISNVNVEDIGPAFVFSSLLDSVVRNLYLQNCAGPCITLGGSALNSNGAQVVSIDTLSDINMVPIHAQIGLVIDSGASEIKLQRIVEAGAAHENPPGAAGGIVIQNSSPGGHKPEGIRLFDPNIDDNEQFNLLVTSGWFIEVHGGSFGTTVSGASVEIAAQDGENDVDGFWLDSGTVRGAAADGVFVKSGCNTRITNNIINANGNGSAHRYAGVRVGPSACGLLEIDGNMMGLDAADEAGWGNALGHQAFAVVLMPHALADFSIDASRRHKGRLMLRGNMMAGNTDGTYVDDSGLPASREIIGENLLK
jgi:hypothetical protein